MKLFIVDDSEILIERVKENLEDIENLEIVGSENNSIEAKVIVGNLKPDLLITDIRMPGGGGLELLEFIKNNFPQIKVIVYTNYPYPQYQEKAYELGAEFFFHKSTQTEEMVEKIKQLCEEEMNFKT